ncbi:TetR/AcrR family transcriptional regulator [Leucobacter ruminantium]|uniref:TetR family transcriptional regulator n=1 Tax=Leucobacter ruminantium TaxID=1289170 RepID=A0A939RXX7_9MICO|nr:TetR/AcrR family transcriptional regulator [Leucobacter ruminantium]MBO1803889.1 TetR family transcriptional regulator [Leucobacter ruminantium]
MPPARIGPASPGDNSAAAIRSLAERGYDATTAEDLAEALGVSRSTFFRRFGGKDDIVFADHDHALARLTVFLESTERPAREAVVQGTLEVMQLLTRDAETARLRSELLRRTRPLRERELVITHRYERLFADYLAAHTPADTPRWVAVAAAAGVVAVHNAALRSWLRDPDPGVIASLDRELRELLARFSPWLGGPDGADGSTRVVVAVADASEPSERILEAVRDALER